MGNKDQTTKVYPMKLNVPKLLLGAISFLIASVALFHIGATNHSGMIINHLVTLSPREAAIFINIIALLAAGMVVFALFTLIKGVGSHKQIVLSKTYITVPKNFFSSVEVRVAIKDITDLAVIEVYRQKFLKIYFKNTNVSISKSALSSKGYFEEIITQLKKYCAERELNTK